jgi:2',3'-cyclic-nucleotide 2'-phosphodiesterase/3'-nucleotidase
MIVLGQLSLALFFFCLTACGSGPTGNDDDDDDEPPPGEQILTILFTADEQANALQGPASQGAAKLMGLWRSAEGYDRDADFLILSGGNSWTGQTISTWFKGASMVEIMGAMDYSGQALGNLEFQFGPDALQDRAGEASFPLLSANLRLKAGGGSPSFATPFAVKDVKGLKVGLIGLTPVTTPQSNVPKNTEDFDFLPYSQALTEVIPRARAAGADLIVVFSRLCRPDLMEFLPVAKQLGVSMVAGGFCGEAFAEVTDGVALVAPKFRFSSYGKVRIRVRKNSKEVLEILAEVKDNAGGADQEEVLTVVEKWTHLAEQELARGVGWVNDAIPNETPALQNLVMDSWLHAYPADIAHLNAGAIRSGIPAGNITLGAVMGALPFANSLVLMELTGQEVVDCLVTGTIVAGMTTRGGYFHSDGTPLKMDSTYHVLTTDFLHGSDLNKYKGYDSNPLFTNMLYSEALLAYLEDLATTPNNPLDLFLDHQPRR